MNDNELADFEALDDAYQHLSWGVASTRYVSYMALLNTVTNEYCETQKDAVQKALLKYWVYALENPDGTRTAILSKQANRIDTFFKLLYNFNKVTEFVQDDYNARILIHACLERVRLYEQQVYLPPIQHVATILYKWTNKDMMDSDITTLSGLVDFIYGPGVWDIYRSDVEENADMPQHLRNMGLPLSKNFIENKDLAKPTESLPADFS